jgi:hypothetical protein
MNSSAVSAWPDADIEVIEFPEWLECPECGQDGTKFDLKRSGHSCCRKFLKELEDENEQEW